jgi:hypothetical protein
VSNLFEEHNTDNGDPPALLPLAQMPAQWRRRAIRRSVTCPSKPGSSTRSDTSVKSRTSQFMCARNCRCGSLQRPARFQVPMRT